MIRSIPLLLSAVAAALLLASGAQTSWAAESQYFEVRTYHLRLAEEQAVTDAYFENALLPALKRQGVGTVGVFIDKDPEGAPNFYLLIPYDSIEQFATMQGKLDADASYQKAAADFFNTPQKEPRYTRIESELLLSFGVFPRPQVPALKKQGKPRLFELRSYESHSEKMGAVKAEMFNSGEVPVFLDCGIQPVFMGRVLSGPKMPDLTYMTVYEDEAHLKEAWAKFGKHPDWQKLRSVPKYKGTVSKIHKHWLTPRPYSDF